MASEQRKIQRNMARHYFEAIGARRICRSTSPDAGRGKKIGKNVRGNVRRSYSTFAGSWKAAAKKAGEKNRRKTA